MSLPPRWFPSCAARGGVPGPATARGPLAWEPDPGPGRSFRLVLIEQARIRSGPAPPPASAGPGPAEAPALPQPRIQAQRSDGAAPPLHFLPPPILDLPLARAPLDLREPGAAEPASPWKRGPGKGTCPARASAAGAFLQTFAEVARATARELGLSPDLLLAQAALETGWGRKSIRGPDGQESHNLFGLKAGRHWKGRTVEVATTEYVQGRAQRRVEAFRAYDSVEAAFADYARLLKRRYGAALAPGATPESFGQALQEGGYATDPDYARKIVRVARSVSARMSADASLA